MAVLAAVAGLASCKKSGSGQGGSAAQGAGTITALETATLATVESVDPADRTVTLRTDDGTTHTYKIGKDVPNFDQIKAGDKVRATVIESVAVLVRKAGEPAGAAERSTMTLAPKGEKPGLVAVDTTEVTAKVDAVNADKRTITVQGADGKEQTFTAGPDVNLAKIKTGDDVVVRYTRAVAVLVEKQ